MLLFGVVPECGVPSGPAAREARRHPLPPPPAAPRRPPAASQGRPAVTTLQAFNAMVQAIEVRMRGSYAVRSLQEWDALRTEGTR